MYVFDIIKAVFYFAHGDEIHETSANASNMSILYISLAIVAVVFVIVGIIFLLSKKKPSKTKEPS